MRLDAATVIREHASMVCRVLRHLGVAESQLDDACQEVFVVICKQLDGFQGRSQLRTWIYGVCRNVASTTRRQRRAREVLVEAPAEQSENATQHDALWVKQACAQLQVALDALDETQRLVFVLYELEELSMDEIAETIGAPLTTCYSRLYSARDKVQSSMRRRARLQAHADLEATS